MRGSSVPPGLGAVKGQGEKPITTPQARKQFVTDLRSYPMPTRSPKPSRSPGMEDTRGRPPTPEHDSNALRTKSQPKRPPPTPLAKEAMGYIGTLRSLGTQVFCDQEASEPRTRWVEKEDVKDIPQLLPEELVQIIPYERRMIQTSKTLSKSWVELAQGLDVGTEKLERIAEEARCIVDMRLEIYAVCVCRIVISVLLKSDPTSDMFKDERIKRELQRAVKLGDLRHEDVEKAEARIKARDGQGREHGLVERNIKRSPPQNEDEKKNLRIRGIRPVKEKGTKDEAPSKVRTQLGLLYSTDSEGGDSTDSQGSGGGSERGYGMAKGRGRRQHLSDESDRESRTSSRSALSPRRERQRRDKEYLQALRATQPGKFKGEVAKPQLLVEWVTQMSQYFSLMNLGRKEEVNIAVSYLEKGASVWWNQVPERKKDRIKSWPVFKDYIIREFLPHDYNLVLWRQLDDTKQRIGVAEYIEKFQEIQRQILDIPEKIAMTKFLNGLKPTIRGHVLALRPRTQREAMRLARNFDNAFFAKSTGVTFTGDNKLKSWKDQTRPYERSKFGRVNAAEELEMNAVNKSREKPLKPNEKSERTTQKKQFKCFNCDKIGHMARDCWAPRKQFGKATVNVVQPESEKNLKEKPQ